MIYMFLSNNPSSGDINSSNLPCFLGALRVRIWRLKTYLEITSDEFVYNSIQWLGKFGHHKQISLPVYPLS